MRRRFCILCLRGIKVKLNFEFIPDTAIGQNLRNNPEWDILRKKVYDIYDRKCQICKRQDCSLDAHEVWEWDEENHIQKLINIIGICRLCHDVIHFNIPRKNDRENEVIEHYLKVNNCDYKIFKQKIAEAKAIKKRRSEINKWEMDLNFIFQKQWIRRIFKPEECYLVDFDQRERCEDCNEFYHIDYMINNKCYSCAEGFEEDITDNFI